MFPSRTEDIIILFVLLIFRGLFVHPEGWSSAGVVAQAHRTLNTEPEECFARRHSRAHMPGSAAFPGAQNKGRGPPLGARTLPTGDGGSPKALLKRFFILFCFLILKSTFFSPQAPQIFTHLQTAPWS